MKKVIQHTLIMLLFITHSAKSQNRNSQYNSMSFYYIDNSSGYELPGLSSIANDKLKEKIQSENSSGNYIFLWASNGKKPFQGDDASEILGAEEFKRISSRNSNDANYDNDIQRIREKFSLYPIKVTQDINFKIYLSPYSINRMFNDINYLPTPLILWQEMIQLVKPISGKLRVNISIFTEKNTNLKVTQDDIMNKFSMCGAYVYLNQPTISVNYLSE